MWRSDSSPSVSVGPDRLHFLFISVLSPDTRLGSGPDRDHDANHDTHHDANHDANA